MFHATWDVLVTLFKWPYGIVVGNLIASVLWVPVTLIHLHRHQNKLHEKLKAHVSDLFDPNTPGGVADWNNGNNTGEINGK